MANYTGKAVAMSVKLVFDGKDYDCKSIPAGVPETAELPNVTVCTDSVQQFAEAAVTEEGAMTFVVADTPPALNAVGALSVVANVSTAGGNAVEQTINCGPCIVESIEPTTIEAGGDRVQTWSVTFRPNGERV